MMRSAILERVAEGRSCRGFALFGAALRGAKLTGADLRESGLAGADLSRADLREAALRAACLHAVDLREADLSRADLRGADLSCADLRGAIFSSADLRGATFRGAQISNATFRGAHRTGALGVVELPSADPRGYRLYAIQPPSSSEPLTEGEWLLTAGCHGPWTTAQARAHWGSTEYVGETHIAQNYLHALEWWEMRGAEQRDAVAS